MISPADAVDRRLAVRRGSPLLRDRRLDDHLAVHGYVVLGPVLGPSTIALLHEVYGLVEASWGEDRPAGWVSTLMLGDPALSLEVSRRVERIVWPALEPWLVPGSASFVLGDLSIKPPGPESQLGAHQDFSLVDEGRHRGAYFWSSLVPSSRENGALHVLPGSHLYGRGVRSSTVRTHFVPVQDEVEAGSVALEVDAGVLVVTDAALVHHTPPNRSDEVRVATHGCLASAGAPLRLYHRSDASADVDVYEVDPSDYPELILTGGAPDGPVVERLLAVPDALGPEELEAGAARYRRLAQAT
jgi:hypothetical protein